MTKAAECDYANVVYAAMRLWEDTKKGGRFSVRSAAAAVGGMVRDEHRDCSGCIVSWANPGNLCDNHSRWDSDNVLDDALNELRLLYEPDDALTLGAMRADGLQARLCSLILADRKWKQP